MEQMRRMDEMVMRLRRREIEQIRTENKARGEPRESKTGIKDRRREERETDGFYHNTN